MGNVYATVSYNKNEKINLDELITRLGLKRTDYMLDYRGETKTHYGVKKRYFLHRQKTIDEMTNFLNEAYNHLYLSGATGICMYRSP